MEKQAEALECYQLIYDSFEKNEIGIPIYPEEYAGAYLEDGNLIVQLTDINEKNKINICCYVKEAVKLVLKKRSIPWVNY